MATHLSTSTSATLLLRLRDLDDQEAWNDFVKRYTPQVFAWCKRNGLQDSDAGDITQDVLTKLVVAMRSFEYDSRRGSFRGWLKTVTQNAVRDLGRSWQKRTQGSGDSRVIQYLHEISRDESLDDLASQIESRYEQELLAEAEDRVKLRTKPKTWEAYRLTAVEQRPAAEVARTLEIPISEVYVAKSRVLKRLREEVSRLEDIRS